MTDRRVFREERNALVEALPDGRVSVRAPMPGLFRDPPAPDRLVRPGDAVGELESLGRRILLRAPAGATGLVVEVFFDPRRASRPVDHGAALVVLDPEAATGVSRDALVNANATATADAFEGLAIRAPSSGRYYARPAPDQDPFVREGDEIAAGHTIALLEVMKTFNRIQYGGGGLPERARVLRVVPADGDDLDAGAVIVELEPTSQSTD